MPDDEELTVGTCEGVRLPVGLSVCACDRLGLATWLDVAEAVTDPDVAGVWVTVGVLVSDGVDA